MAYGCRLFAYQRKRPVGVMRMEMKFIHFDGKFDFRLESLDMLC